MRSVRERRWLRALWLASFPGWRAGRLSISWPDAENPFVNEICPRCFKLDRPQHRTVRGRLLSRTAHQRDLAMRSQSVLAHDSEFGSFINNDRLPLIQLRERRRELVLSLQSDG